MVAMSNNQDWYDDDDLDLDEEVVEQEQSAKDVLAKVRRAERNKDKQLKQLQSELEELRRFKREVSVTKVLSEKGINPKVAAFIPQDIEVNEDSITSWIEQYAEVFGGAAKEAQPESKVSQNDLAALAQINAATSGAMSPEGASDVASAIQNAQSPEEIIRLLNG
jgi:hypothetical protein